MRVFLSTLAVLFALYAINVVVYQPNRTKELVGYDISKPTGPERQVEQAKQIARSVQIDAGIQEASKVMRWLAAEQRRLDRAVRQLKARRDVDRRKIQDSGILDRLTTLKNMPDMVTLAAFEAHAREIKNVSQLLKRGGNPVAYQDFLGEAEATLKIVQDSNQARREAATDIREMLEEK